jgi:Zn-dependent protease with chaperone function
MILAFLAQSILHGLLAAVLVETLLGRWRIEDAVWRLRFRLVALAVPVAGLPILLLAAPFRENAQFATRWALFAGERWNQVRVAGTGLGDLVLLCSAALGSALFLRDALPPLLDMVRGSSPLPRSSTWHGSVAVLRPVVERHARALGIPAPGIRVVQASTPILLCEGARQPVLVVSSMTLERLRGAELDVAVAHELAHAAHRDPAWGYALIVVRAALFFNPAIQWVARALVDDIECRADQVAARTTGNAVALTRVIRTLFHADNPPPVDGDASFERVFWRVRKEGVERRCARLEQTESAVPVTHGPALLALAGATLLALVFFIV